MTAWPVFVFGAPGAIIWLALCVAGLLRFRPVLLVAGALALKQRRQLIAGLVLVPNATAVLWLTMTTISNLMVS